MIKLTKVALGLDHLTKAIWVYFAIILLTSQWLSVVYNSHVFCLG